MEPGPSNAPTVVKQKFWSIIQTCRFQLPSILQKRPMQFFFFVNLAVVHISLDTSNLAIHRPPEKTISGGGLYHSSLTCNMQMSSSSLCCIASEFALWKLSPSLFQFKQGFLALMEKVDLAFFTLLTRVSLRPVKDLEVASFTHWILWLSDVGSL